MRNFKIQIAIIILLINCFSFAQENFWKHINGPSGIIQSIVTKDSGNKIFCNSSNIVYRSFDNGVSWDSVQIDSQYKNPSLMVKTPNGNLWLGFSNGILQSTDDGSTWEMLGTIPFSMDVGFFNIVFDSVRNYSYALTGYNVVWRSKDGGHTWEFIGPGGAPDLRDLAIDKNGNLYLAGGHYIARSTDAGASWSSIYSELNAGIYTILTIDDEIYGISMNDIVQSFDNGKTFQVKKFSGFPYRYSQFRLFANKLHQFYFTAYQYEPTMQYSLPIWTSNSRGEQWYADTSGLPVKSVLNLTIGDKGILYAATENGIYKSLETVTPVTLSKTDLFFNSVKVWESKQDTVIMTNSINQTISGFAFSTNNKFTIDNPSYSLLPGESKAFYINYNPDSIFTDEGYVKFYIDYLQDTISVYCNGNGTTPRIVPGKLVLDFGKILLNSTKTLQVAIINTDTITANISNIVTSNPAFSVIPTSFSINPNDSVSLTVQFTPNVKGSYSDSIFVYADGKLKPSAIIKVLGETIKPIHIKIFPYSYDFNVVKPGRTKTTTLKIYNKGELQPLVISNIISSGNVFSVSPISGSILPGDSMEISIQFNPTKSGIFNDSIMVSSNDEDNPTVKFYVSGTGSQVASVYPLSNSLCPNDSTSIIVKFGLQLNASTISDSSIKIIGSYSGIHKSSSISYNSSNSSINILPENPFVKCEQVTVSMTNKIKTTEDKPIFPYIWDFFIQPKSSSLKFRLKNTITIAGGATEVDGKDLDNDGDLDLIVISHDKMKLYIYKNNVNWNFEKILELNGGFGPTKFLTGDYDGDGDLDFVITNVSSELLFYKNNGNWNFTPIQISVPGYLEMITQGDYDGDGDIDFVTASSASDNNYDIIKNEGNFQFTVYNYKGYSGPLISSDLDNDGDIDVIHSNNILVNKGNFIFNPINVFPDRTIKVPFDPDGDGDLDLVDPGGYSSFYIYRNDGDLKFTPLSYSSNNSNSNFNAVANDLDGDGLEDLCITSYPNLFMIYKNTGNMQFNFMSKTVLPKSVDYTQDLVNDLKSLDIDNDGDNDLVFVSLGPGVDTGFLTLYENRDNYSEVTLSSNICNFGPVVKDSLKSISFFIKNTGNLPLVLDTLISSNNVFKVLPDSGLISPSDSLEIIVTFTPKEIKIYNDSIAIHSNDEEKPVVYFYLTGRTEQTIIASVYPKQNSVVQNGDTILIAFSENVLAVSLNDSTIRIYGSKSGFHFCKMIYDESAKTISLYPTKPFITGEKVNVTITDKIQLADLTPVLNSFAWSFSIGVKEGLANFIKADKFPAGSTSSYIEYLRSADFNNDGLSDLVLSDNGTNNITLYISEYGRGPVFNKNISAGLYPGDIICADFNNDGNIDIALNTHNSITLFKNNGDLSFAKYTITFNSSSDHLIPGDFDGDGDIDIAGFCFNNYKPYIWLLLNKGNFQFQKDSLISIRGTVLQMSAADIDNDGDIDILCASESQHSLTLLRNDKDLNFEKIFLPNIYGYISTVVIEDFNLDGNLDIAAQWAGGNSACILTNEGSLNFQVVYQQGITHDPLFLTGGDFDADGDFDLVSIDNGYSPYGSIYLNDSLVFSEAGRFIKEEGSHNIVNSDLNGDGSLDIAFTTSWMMNTGIKSYALSKYSDQFTDTKLGEISYLYLTLFNVGQDTLTVDSMYFTNKYFTAGSSGFTVLPSDSEIIQISFKPDSVYHYIDTLNICSQSSSYNKVIIEGNAIPFTGVEDDKGIPTEYTLSQNYPNPFNPSTIISYEIPKSGLVTIKIFDVLGREIETLVNEENNPGRYNEKFDGSNLASGLYFYRITSGKFSETKKMLLLK